MTLLENLMKTFSLFVVIDMSKGYNNMPTVYVLRSPKNNCWNPLMEAKDLPDDRFSASSFFLNKSNFQAHQARLVDIFRSNPQPESGNAWCPSKKVSTHLKEWIEVDFQSMKIINGIYTKGRGEGNFIEFVPRIHITYKRKKEGRVFEYRTMENNSIIPINTDARTQSRTSFIPAIIASSIKIYPFDPHHTNLICIKFAMFGCSFHDSPISYSTYDGDIPYHHKIMSMSTIDKYYDGNKIYKGEKVFLKDGLGLLSDNRAWLGNLDLLREAYFLGWYTERESQSRYIQISFEYDKIRNFSKIQIFSYMLSNKTIDIFSMIHLTFLIDTKIESEVKETISRKNLYLSRFGGVIFTMNLIYNVANVVQIRLFTSSEKWIILSEINFESTIAEETSILLSQSTTSFDLVKKLENKNNKSSDTLQKKIISKKNNQDFYPNKVGHDIFLDPVKDTTFAVATIVSLILLVIFIIIIGLILYKMKQKRQCKKNNKMQYIIGNEIGSIYQQYSQSEKIKHFSTPALQQTISIASDNSSFDSPAGRILDTSIYSSLPHNNNKDSISIREDETYLLKEYNNNLLAKPSSIKNVSQYSNQRHSLKNSVITTYSWNSSESFQKNRIQYKKSSGSSDFLHNDYKFISRQHSPQHVLTGSPLFSNSPLGMSQLPSTIQIITNPYFNHPDNISISAPNDYPTPVPSHKSFNLMSNDSRNNSPYSLSRNSFLCWVSPEANYFSNFDFSKLIQIQSVCGHISFGSLDFQMTNKKYISFFDSKLPLMSLSNITTTDVLCQGQYGEVKRGMINDNTIQSRIASSVYDKLSAKIYSNEKCKVILTILNENTPPDIRSQFQDELRIRLRLSDPNIAAVLAMVSDSIDSDNNNLLNYQFGIVTENLMNLHHYIRTQTIDEVEIPKSLADFSYTSQNPSTLNNYLNYGSLIFISNQIASGMKHMEDQGIIHRDLACRNCMVSSNLQVKIGNGGRQISSPFEPDYLSIPLSDFTNIHLPIRWMSPESLFNGKFSSKSDVWAFGVTVWEVLTHCNQQPYFYWSNSQVMENLYNALLPQNSQFHHLTRPKICPKEIYDMIRECWHPIEDYRPNFHEINMFLQRKCIGFYNTDKDISKSMI